METRYYRTVAQARGALALDVGFDPFVSGGWGRCTKKKLAEHGYLVDPTRFVTSGGGDHLCLVCQRPVRRRWTVEEGPGDWPTHCPEHTRTTRAFRCDAGHHWTSTEAEDRARDHRCPTCGDYWQ